MLCQNLKVKYCEQAKVMEQKESIAEESTSFTTESLMEVPSRARKVRMKWRESQQFIPALNAEYSTVNELSLFRS